MDKVVLPQGEMQFVAPRLDIVRLTLSGFGHKEFVDPMCKILDRAMLLSNRPVALFLDLEGLKTYDSDLRKQMQGYLLAHRSQLDKITTLTASPLVAMGVYAASLVLKNIVAFRDRKEFEAAYESRRRTPTLETRAG